MKKTFKKLAAIALSGVMVTSLLGPVGTLTVGEQLFPSLFIRASAYTEPSFEFSDEGKTVTISGTGKLEGRVYDDLYYDHPGVTKVILQGFTGISDDVFEHCEFLEEVIINDEVTVIGNSAFNGCIKLKKIVIPANVTSIGEYAFGFCYALKSVTFKGESCSIARNAFEGVGDDLRPGNNGPCEIIFPDSWTGVKIGAEGPFKSDFFYEVEVVLDHFEIDQTTGSATKGHLFACYYRIDANGDKVGEVKKDLGQVVGANGQNGGQGATGETGAQGVGIASIEKTSSESGVDTYTITLTDGNTSTFTVTNGTNGSNGTNGTNGEDGKTPQLRINSTTNMWEVSYDNGVNWSSLGVKATGKNGSNGTNGRNGTNGQDGSSLLTGSSAPANTLGKNGDSYIDVATWDFYTKANDTWTKQGNIKGANGSNGTNGQDGVGIAKIEKTSSEGLVDTYTITLTNGQTSTFTVTNGEKGDQGEQGIQGIKGDQGERGIQGVMGDKGEQGIQGIKGDQGERGIQGVMGDKGEKGDQGEKGESGNTTLPITLAALALLVSVGNFFVNLFKKKKN